MSRLAIIGASGHGKVVADTAELCGWQFIEFFDDAWPAVANVGVWRVFGDTSSLLSRIDEFDGVVVAIGNNAVRLAKTLELSSSGKLIKLIHPSAVISRYAFLDVGSVMFAGSVINAGARVQIGAIINTNAVVEHDCILGLGVHISPNATLSGGVHVGDLSWIGAGAAVRQSILIGSQVTVGAGAVVVSPISDGITVAGVPAREIKKPVINLTL